MLKLSGCGTSDLQREKTTAMIKKKTIVVDCYVSPFPNPLPHGNASTCSNLQSKLHHPNQPLNPSYIANMNAELGADLATVIPHPL